MFDAKDVIGEAVARAVKLFAAHKRGDIVPWSQVEAVAGFTRESPQWTQFNKRFRRDFRRASGVVVWPVNGVGLKLLTHAEQLVVPLQKRQARALRQVTRGMKELGSLPDAELTEHQRAAKHRKLDQAKAARRAVLYSQRIGHKLARPSSPDLPRPVPAKQAV